MGSAIHNMLDRDWAKVWRLPHTRSVSAKVRSLLVAGVAGLLAVIFILMLKPEGLFTLRVRR